jgi:hypothetical protein
MKFKPGDIIAFNNTPNFLHYVLSINYFNLTYQVMPIYGHLLCIIFHEPHIYGAVFVDNEWLLVTDILEEV